MKKILQTIGQKTCPRCHDAKILITVSWKKFKDGRIEKAWKQTTACGVCQYVESMPLTTEQLAIARAIVEKDERPPLAEQFAVKKEEKAAYRDPSEPTQRPDGDIDVTTIPF